MDRLIKRFSILFLFLNLHKVRKRTIDQLLVFSLCPPMPLAILFSLCILRSRVQTLPHILWPLYYVIYIPILAVRPVGEAPESGILFFFFSFMARDTCLPERPRVWQSASTVFKISIGRSTFSTMQYLALAFGFSKANMC